MKLNFFARNEHPEPEQSTSPPPSTVVARPPTGKTFPADEVFWGIVIRNGFDEMDDPWYHRGTTQHAYLEGNDNVAICGFRPPQSGPRTRRRPRLGMPTAGEHPMCGSCARMVVAPRPRVPVPVQGARPPVAVPVARPATPAAPPAVPAIPPAVPAAPPAVPATGPVAVPAAQPAPVQAGAPVPPPPPAAPAAQPPGTAPVSPWVRQRAGGDAEPAPETNIQMGASHDGGLLRRGVHTEAED